MPIEELIDAGYELSGPGDTLTATGHGTSFEIAPDSPGAEVQIDAAVNYAALYDKLTQAQTYFQDNYAAWGSMTAGQKDTANRNAQRALANLIRHVRRDLSSEGI